jgi:hypothetical protein
VGIDERDSIVPVSAGREDLAQNLVLKKIADVAAVAGHLELSQCSKCGLTASISGGCKLSAGAVCSVFFIPLKVYLPDALISRRAIHLLPVARRL